LSPFPRPLLPAACLLAAAIPARAQAVLDVSGEVASVAPRLEVRVVVSNRGDRPAAPLDVAGELLGESASVRLESGVAPGGSGAVVLGFSPSEARPGLHALSLLLEHPVEGPPDGAGNPPVASQVAWLLLALGENPGPAVRLAADRASLDVTGEIPVRVESADGSPHRVLLRVRTARGLRAEGEGVALDVPASGEVTAALPILRAGAPRGSRHAVLLLAEDREGPLARTAVLAVGVDVRATPSLLGRLRPHLLALGLALLAIALGVQGWRAVRA
jgi:hypothetical protein